MSNSIDITAQSLYLEHESSPDNNRYVFAYTITIANAGDEPARLMSRHWLVTDAQGKMQEVHGDGVVGEQPRLEPGQAFRYTSASVIATPVGSMHGTYKMRTDNGQVFDAPIPAFGLAVPGSLN